MTMTDPIADMLTRIRNAHKIKAKSVTMPSSAIKVNIAKVLLREGYVKGFDEEEIGNGKKDLNIHLKYYQGSPVIEKMNRVSRPGLRIYKTRTQLPKVMGGLGIAIVSTSNGIMSDKEAREQGEGGEILCFVT